MTPPDIATSSREDREHFILEEFRCLGDCEFCGHCQMLHHQDALVAYHDYIEGKKSFRDITLALRY
jgi:hypothetical protein